jgi:hypothetical protein
LLSPPDRPAGPAPDPAPGAADLPHEAQILLPALHRPAAEPQEPGQDVAPGIADPAGLACRRRRTVESTTWWGAALGHRPTCVSTRSPPISRWRLALPERPLGGGDGAGVRPAEGADLLGQHRRLRRGAPHLCSRWEGRPTITGPGHCHAPSCLSMELYNADTGMLLCRHDPVYGQTHQVGGLGCWKSPDP